MSLDLKKRGREMVELKSLFKTHFPGTIIPKTKSTSYMKNLLFRAGVINTARGTYKTLTVATSVFPCRVQDINIEIISHVISDPRGLPPDFFILRSWENFGGIPDIFLVCKSLYNFWTTSNLWDIMLTKKFETQIAISGKGEDKIEKMRGMCFSFIMLNPFTQWRKCVELCVDRGYDEIYSFLLSNKTFWFDHTSPPFAKDLGVCPNCGCIHEEEEHDDPLVARTSSSRLDASEDDLLSDVEENEDADDSARTSKLSLETSENESGVFEYNAKEIEWHVQILTDIVYHDQLSRLQKYGYIQDFILQIPPSILADAIGAIITVFVNHQGKRGLVPTWKYPLGERALDIIIEVLFYALPDYDKIKKMYEPFGWAFEYVVPSIKSLDMLTYAEKYFGVSADGSISEEIFKIYKECMKHQCGLSVKSSNMEIIKYIAISGKLNRCDEEDWISFCFHAASSNVVEFLLDFHEYIDLEDLINTCVGRKRPIPLSTIFALLHKRKHIFSDGLIIYKLFLEYVTTIELLDMFLDMIDPEIANKITNDNRTPIQKKFNIPKYDKKLSSICLGTWYRFTDRSVEFLEKCIINGLRIGPYMARAVRNNDPEVALLFVKHDVYIPDRSTTLLKLACVHDNLELFTLAFSPPDPRVSKHYRSGRVGNIKLNKYIVLCIKNYSVNVLERLLMRLSTGKPKINGLYETLLNLSKSIVMTHVEKTARIIALLDPFDIISKKDLYCLALKVDNKSFTNILVQEGVLDGSLPYL
jgi:hypothetical protein